jgi:hypothetical protein
MRSEEEEIEATEIEGVETNNSSCAELTEAMKRGLVRDANSCLQDSKLFFGEQGPLEVSSRLPFGKFRHLPFHAQELYNQFAHLLNRGSSLE